MYQDHVRHVDGFCLLVAGGPADGHLANISGQKRTTTAFRGGHDGGDRTTSQTWLRVYICSLLVQALFARASNNDIKHFLADAAFSIGMKALGAFGPWGKIAAAVAGFARGIVHLIKQRKDLATMDDDGRRWTTMDDDGRRWTTMDDDRRRKPPRNDRAPSALQPLRASEHRRNSRFSTSLRACGRRMKVLEIVTGRVAKPDLDGELACEGIPQAC